MKLCDLLAGFAVSALSPIPADAEIDRIEYDSRKADGNSLFVCMPGARVDGHDFAAAAYRLGCRSFLCQRKPELPSDALILLAEDTRALLPSLSARFYGNPADSLRLVGITGTKGKTTTALLTTEILNRSGIPAAYIGSNGVIIKDTHIETANTTPESRELHRYFRMMADAGIKVAVLEVSSQALARHRVDGLTFEVTAFLNLSRDHIGENEHPTFDDYLLSKSKLFTDYGTSAIIANRDDGYTDEILRGATAPITYFSMKPGTDADFRGSSVEIWRDDAALGVTFACTADGETVPVRLRSPGAFSAANAMAAIAVARYFGVSPCRSAALFYDISVLGRCEVVDAIPGVVSVIDYAHNGVSLRQTLTALRAYHPRRLICLFGSVGGRTRERREELGSAAAELADYSIITSDNPDFENPDGIIRDISAFFPDPSLYETVTDRAEAIARAVQLVRPGDILLLAGKGHERYQLVAGKRVPFCEKEILLREAARLPAGT